MSVARIPGCDLHTHSSFCVGKDSPEAFVLEALRRGMETLGFSAYAPAVSRSAGNAEPYRRELLRLRNLYGDQLHILLGLEQDALAAKPTGEWDYIIGAVHALPSKEGPVPIDSSREALQRLVRECFGGDFYRLAAQYFCLVAELPARTGCQIVGHFDLLAKFNADGALFDENDPRYLRPAMDALDALLAEDTVFEINTADMRRGARRVPYPAPLFLRRIAEKRGLVTLGSDACESGELLGGFSEALQIARAAGIGGVSVLTRSGWEFRSI